MDTVTEVAAAHYVQQASLADATAYRAQVLWQMVDRAAILDSWASLLPQAVRLVKGSQLMAASTAQSYVTDALNAQGLDSAGADINASAFAGIASDGRPLSSLLSAPAYTALSGIKSGQSMDRAMGAGLNQLLLMSSTQVTDAGRVAGGVGIASRRTETGYIRMISSGACSRCAVLAGKYYRWNAGFSRHPRCRCYHLPAESNSSGSDKRTDPYQYFNSLSRAEQDRIFGVADSKAINDGADIYQVVNARRGMNPAGMKTTEGTSKRGYYRGQSGSTVRLTPEAIYKLNGNDRIAAMADLEKYGYILPQGQIPGGAIRNGVR